MKKYMLIPCALLAFGAQAQNKPAPKKTTPATSKAAPAALKTQTDSISYAIGMSVANFYSQMGVQKINTAQVAKAINDVMSKKKLLMTDQEAQMLMMRIQNEIAQQGSAKNIKAGEQYLANNKKRAGVKVTASGLQYEVITEGKGVKPTAEDTVEVNYRGMLIDGTEFDNSYKRGQPISFHLNGVIRGWTEGLQLMTAGSKYRFYIPYQLGYGLQGAGGGAIPGGAVLIFDVELLSVKKK